MALPLQNEGHISRLDYYICRKMYIVRHIIIILNNPPPSSKHLPTLGILVIQSILAV